jgi:hypothetical protein
MSYAHTKRRKLIKKMKKEHKANWYKMFRAKVDKDVKDRLGVPIRLSDILFASCRLGGA